MTPLAHNLTAAAMGLSAAIWMKDGSAFFLGAMIGARAPDWMEIASFDKVKMRRVSVIPHRTLTHWPWPWLLVTLSFVPEFFTLDSAVPGDTARMAVFGFAAAGLLHLIMDYMTVMGIPWGNPFGRRRSLGLLKTGSWREIPIIAMGFIGLGLSGFARF